MTPAAWFAGRSERVIETSCAWVFLNGDEAIKIKKPVNLGFLDFSTMANRRWALERELKFNQDYAPDIYRKISPVTRAGDGFALGGEGAAADWALEMRRFDDSAVLSNCPEIIDAALAEALGRLIAKVHAGAPVRPNGGGLWALGYAIASNAQHLGALAPRLGADITERVLLGIDAELSERADLLETRRKQGFARRCHGDLHLGNILVENGAPKLFDCIEFNDLLSDIDTLYDLAFVLMDLGFRGRTDAANRLMNAYLDEAARLPGASQEFGLAALPLMLATRACVRAHVAAGSNDDALACAYLAAAEGHLRREPARLTAIGGLSGSGKTTLARQMAPGLGLAPGAVILRSDEIRKRLHHVAPLTPLGPEAYTAEASVQVYREMFDKAASLLGAGRSVILDAVFLDLGDRQGAEAVARAAGVAFEGLWRQGASSELSARLAARAADASDADTAVLEAQLARDPGPISWTIDAKRFD